MAACTITPWWTCCYSTLFLLKCLHDLFDLLSSTFYLMITVPDKKTKIGKSEKEESDFFCRKAIFVVLTLLLLIPVLQFILLQNKPKFKKRWREGYSIIASLRIKTNQFSLFRKALPTKLSPLNEHFFLSHRSRIVLDWPSMPGCGSPWWAPLSHSMFLAAGCWHCLSCAGAVTERRFYWFLI